MNVVLEGQLSEKWGMREVLVSIGQLDLIETGILRIASAGEGVNGRMAFSRGRFITGALLSESAGSGYQAVRELLSVENGNFAFLDTGGAEPIDVDQSLHISVSKIVSLLPNLPADAASLFDEEALLDRVFGAEPPPPTPNLRFPTEDSGPHNPWVSQPRNPPDEPVGEQPGWQEMAPLIFDGTSAANQGPLIKSSKPAGIAFEDGRVTFSKLKTIAGRGVGQFPGLLWAAIIIVVLGAVWLFSPLKESGRGVMVDTGSNQAPESTSPTEPRHTQGTRYSGTR